jgi:hypothetical protein
VPSRRRDFARPLTAFSPPFQAEVEAFLTRGTEPDVFSEHYSKPIADNTVRNRRRHILMAAMALVHCGTPIQTITGLDMLLDPVNAKAILRFLHHRAGDKTTDQIYQIATLLKTIARHYLRRPQAHVDQLRKLCKALKPEHHGLTEKNKACLRQFADEARLAALLMLPQRVINEVHRRDRGRRGDAVRVAFALAVGIELVIQIRMHNLAGLRLDRHIHRIGNRVLLMIPAQETKNDNPIDAELPPHLVRLLELYLQRYRPRLWSGPSPYLFPGENGECRPPGGFGKQISTFLAKEVGVTMTPHQFRHLAAKLYLDDHPDGFETVRRLLGHKSIATTMRFYRELESVVATRRYNEFLEQKIVAAQTSVKLRRTGKSRTGRKPGRGGKR